MARAQLSLPEWVGVNLPYTSQVFILFSGPYYTCQNGGDFFSANNDASELYWTQPVNFVSFKKQDT